MLEYALKSESGLSGAVPQYYLLGVWPSIFKQDIS
jgi:hypothetical protein